MDALRKKTDEASTDDVAVEENQGGEGMEAGIAEGGDSVGKTELDKAESDEVKVSVVLPAFFGYFSGLNWCSKQVLEDVPSIDCADCGHWMDLWEFKFSIGQLRSMSQSVVLALKPW